MNVGELADGALIPEFGEGLKVVCDGVLGDGLKEVDLADLTAKEWVPGLNLLLENLGKRISHFVGVARCARYYRARANAVRTKQKGDAENAQCSPQRDYARSASPGRGG